MDTDVLQNEVLRQNSITGCLPLLADVLRSDVLYYELVPPDRLVVAEHAAPRSTKSVYPHTRKDERVRIEEYSHLRRAVKQGAHCEGVPLSSALVLGNACQEILPVRDHHGAVMGVLSVETSEVERGVARQRGAHYRRAMATLKQQAARGELHGADALGGFTARDGLVIVGSDHCIRYVSNIAEGFYAKVGVTPPLLGQRIEKLETGDEHIIWQSVQEQRCVEQESAARDSVWLRKAIPLNAARGAAVRSWRGWLTLPGNGHGDLGVLLLIRDVTEQHLREQERVRLENMFREIHHRVKNNLQSIISMTRIEARQTPLPETKRAMEELANRVFAVAKVHEFLSLDGTDTIVLKEVSRQIASQVGDSLLPRGSRIRIEVEGDATPLPPKQATACALAVTELVQNAVEHAFDEGAGGVVRIQLEDGPERVRIAVVDDGRGVPPGFEWRHSQSLGLKIVHTLIQDLRGEFKLSNRASPLHGLNAQITLSRLVPGGK